MTTLNIRLPVHPRTGFTALGFRKDGRPIWPVAGGDGTATTTPTRSPFLQALYDERRSVEDFMERTVQGALTGGADGARRDLSQTEQETLTRSRTRIGELDAQIRPLEEFEQLRAAGDSAARTYLRPAAPAPNGEPRQVTGLGAQVTTRPHVYRTRGECVVDQLRAAPKDLGGFGDPDARERLMSAGMVYRGMADADVAIAESNARNERHRWLYDHPDQARTQQLTSTLTGVLPTPIIGDVMSDLDISRPFIASIGAKALDAPGKTFTRPVITAHTASGKQTTELTTTGLGSSALTITPTTFTKELHGGWLDVSRQDIDWTAPSAWDALLNDLQGEYAIDTENTACDAFATATAGTPIEVGGTGSASTLTQWIQALYSAASAAYLGAGQLPDTIWASLDMWSTLGPLIEAQVATNLQPGTTSPGSFDGNLLHLPRIVVPNFANGTLIIGAKRWTEVYEERVGLLTVVQPSTFGVQVAYGGYIAFGTLKAAAFKAVVNLV